MVRSPGLFAGVVLFCYIEMGHRLVLLVDRP